MAVNQIWWGADSERNGVACVSELVLVGLVQLL
jgi:hypothetical protein